MNESPTPDTPDREKTDAASETDSVDSIDAQRIQDELPRHERAPVVWKPEDATRFFMAAIQEAQKPLVQALRRPSVPLSAMLVMLLVAGAAAFGIYQVYREQTGELRGQTKQLRAANDRMHAETMDAARKAALAEAKLAASESSLTRFRDLIRVLEKENRTLEEGLLDARRRLDQVQAKENIEILRLKKGIADAYAEQNRLRKSLKIAQVRLDGQEEQNRALEKQLRAAKDLLAALQESLDAEVYQSAADRRAKRAAGNAETKTTAAPSPRAEPLSAAPEETVNPVESQPAVPAPAGDIAAVGGEEDIEAPGEDAPVADADAAPVPAAEGEEMPVEKAPGVAEDENDDQ